MERIPYGAPPAHGGMSRATGGMSVERPAESAEPLTCECRNCTLAIFPRGNNLRAAAPGWPPVAIRYAWSTRRLSALLDRCQLFADDAFGIFGWQVDAAH